MRTLRSIALAGLVLATALVAPGCESFQYTEEDRLPSVSDYIAAEPIDVSEFDALWERGKQAVMAEGYAIEDDLTSFSKRRIVSRWSTFLAPSRLDGRRRRALVSYEALGAGRWIVSAIVSQVNTDWDDPLNPVKAEWDDEGADVSRSQILLYKIESGFRAGPLKLDDDE